MTVNLTPMSQHGKTRIKEHGDEWTVTGKNESMKRIKLESKQTGYIRWINEENDKHFRIQNK